jgi:hypothetical protein
MIYSNTTEYLNKLGIKTDTLLFKNGGMVYMIKCRLF